MSNDTTTVKPGGSAEFKLTPKTDLDNSVEVFNAADLQTKAGALETAFSEFAQILGEVNTYVNAEVNTSHDKCVFGPGYGTQLLKLWNDNASTFGDFHANFESWSQAIAIIANKNSQTEVDIRAIYGDRGDTITAFDENGITNESIAAMRERINLEDTALNDFGGNSYTYYDENGNLISVQKDANGNIVGQIIRDANGNIISETYTDSDGNYAVIAYDENGNPVVTYYDKDGNVLTTKPDSFNTDGTLTEAEKKELGVPENPTQEEIDELGYDPSKWDENGINRETGTPYDSEGYDVNGYDKEGYNKDGFNKDGIHRETGNEFGPDGYNQDGFNEQGIHKETGNEFGPDGYDVNGYDREGFDANGFDKSGINKETGDFYDKNGYDVNGYDKEGYNKDGFNKDGIHKETGDEFGPDGYNKDGYDAEGYDRDGYDVNGYDKDGYDKDGFSAGGVHKDTGNPYGPDGYNKDGYDKDGYNRQGYDKDGYDKDGYDYEGWDKDGVHKETGNEYGPDGYNKDGYDENGFDRDGYDKDGLDKDGNPRPEADGGLEDGQEAGTEGGAEEGTEGGSEGDTEGGSEGYDSEGYDAEGYDAEGYNREGYNAEGFDREGYDKNGYNAEGYDKDGYNSEGYDAEGYNKDGYNAEGEARPMSVAEAGLENRSGSSGGKIIDENAEVRETDVFGEGTREATYQQNGKHYVTYFDKDGQPIYTLVSDKPIDVNGDLSGVEVYDSGGYDVSADTFKASISGDAGVDQGGVDGPGENPGTGDMDNDGIPDSEDIYDDDVTVQPTSVTVHSGQKVTIDGKDYYYLMSKKDGSMYYTLSNDPNAQVYVDKGNGPEILVDDYYWENGATRNEFVKQYKNNLEVGWSATYNNGSSPFDSVDTSSSASYDGVSSNSSNQTFIYNDYQSIQDSAVPLSSINFGEVSLGRQELPEVIYVAPGDNIRWDPTDFLDFKDIHIEGGSEGKYLVLDPTTNTYYAADSSGSVFADGGDDSDWNAISVDRLLSEDTEIDTK